MNLRLKISGNAGTRISSEFIDRYMASADGNYVKVYLYIARHENNPLELKNIADAISLTLKDVDHAILYLKDKGLLEEVQEAQPVKTAIVIKAVQAQAGNTHADCLVRENRFDEDLRKLTQKYEQYSGIITPDQIAAIGYMKDDLRMETDLIDYLIEYCGERGKLSRRYFETVGTSWHSQGIKTREDAKALIENRGNRSGQKGYTGNRNKFLNVARTNNDYEGMADAEEMYKVIHGFD